MTVVKVGSRSGGSLIANVRSGGSTFIGHVPGALRSTRAGARNTTEALQAWPDPALRGLAATSVGLAAGFLLAGAPRVATALGAAPALLAAVAIILRPNSQKASGDRR